MTIQYLKDNNLILLECISGSKAYGLDTVNSDTDIKGVFYLPKEQFYGLNYTAQVSNESNDEVYYELGRFIELLGKNNPNALELLATSDDCILHKHCLMEHISVEQFLSKQCKDTFAGYAHSQIKKARGLKKKIVNPLEKERKSVVDFCYVLDNNSSVELQQWLHQNQYRQAFCGLSAIHHTKGMYALFYDEASEAKYKGIVSGPDANEVSLSSIPKGAHQKGYLYFNAEHYSSYCREYREYWDWVEKRNENRYLGNKEHGKSYDSKNMMHTVRLLQVADEIFAEGKFQIRRNNRDELLKIKSGHFEYNELLEMADQLLRNIESNYLKSELRDYVDLHEAEKILVTMRNELYK